MTDQFTCLHDTCLHNGYTVKTSGGLRKHHRKLKLHPCCQNGNKCHKGRSIRIWTDKPPRCLKPNEFKCQHSSCSSDGFASLGSRANHHRRKHHCATACKICAKQQKKKTILLQNFELSDKVKQIVKSVDLEKLQVERIVRDNVTFNNAIVITTDESTGNSVCYPYRSTLQASVAGIRTSIPQLAPQQLRFLRSVEECPYGRSKNKLKFLSAVPCIL